MRPAAAIIAKSIMLTSEIMWELALLSSLDSSGVSEEVGVYTILSVHIKKKRSKVEQTTVEEGCPGPSFAVALFAVGGPGLACRLESLTPFS